MEYIAGKSMLKMFIITIVHSVFTVYRYWGKDFKGDCIYSSDTMLVIFFLLLNPLPPLPWLCSVS